MQFDIVCQLILTETGLGEVTNSAEHLASPKPGTKKNWFETNHFVKQLITKQ